MDSPEALFSFKVPPELLDYIDQKIEQKLAAIRDTTTVEQKPVFYSRQEVAKILCISIPTLNRHVIHGIIKSQKVGNRVLFSQEDISQALHKKQK